MVLLVVTLAGCTKNETNNQCTDSAQCGNGNKSIQGSKPTAMLEVAKLEAEIREGVPMKQVDNTYGIDAKPVEIKGGGLGVHIDITVKNLGSNPAFIPKVIMTFRKSGYPEPCVGIGGPLVTTATYSFTIPDDQPIESDGSYLHKTPFTLSKEVTHEIPPNKYEKFTLTVGPETVVDQANPWFGVLDITLERDGGKKVKTGPLAVVNTGGNSMFYPDGDSWFIDKKNNPECMKRNALAIREIMKTPGLTVSKEFASLDKALSAYL
ncbi:hypothetical protein [Streptomyces sp. NPDC006134]|uniref:hypothetical protein n=1 Tax=Streptomyces sp. NPDC006134 TaxID=3154467 RepID=UPI0033EAA8C1